LRQKFFTEREIDNHPPITKTKSGFARAIANWLQTAALTETRHFINKFNIQSMYTKISVAEKLPARGARQLAAIAIAAFTGVSAFGTASVQIDSDIAPMVSKSQVLAHVDLNMPISMVFVLPLEDPAGAESYAMRVNTPEDPLYKQHLTPEQFGVRFGPSETDYNAVLTWAISTGLKPGEPSRSRLPYLCVAPQPSANLCSTRV
jgi:Pro-kumamolisin, activation domain